MGHRSRGHKSRGVVLGPGRLNDILFRDRVLTGAENGYVILNQIRILVDMMEKKLGYRPQKLGIGTPGTLDPGLGVMKGCNSRMQERPADEEDLERSSPGSRSRVRTNASCFALAGPRMGIVKEKIPECKSRVWHNNGDRYRRRTGCERSRDQRAARYSRRSGVITSSTNPAEHAIAERAVVSR